jgi:hypothetical protein
MTAENANQVRNGDARAQHKKKQWKPDMTIEFRILEGHGKANAAESSDRQHNHDNKPASPVGIIPGDDRTPEYGVLFTWHVKKSA